MKYSNGKKYFQIMLKIQNKIGELYLALNIYCVMKDISFEVRISRTYDVWIVHFVD